MHMCIHSYILTYILTGHRAYELPDQRAVELMSCRTNGSSDLSDQWAHRTNEPSDQGVVGPQVVGLLVVEPTCLQNLACQTNGPLNQWAIGPTGRRTKGRKTYSPRRKSMSIDGKPVSVTPGYTSTITVIRISKYTVLRKGHTSLQI